MVATTIETMLGGDACLFKKPGNQNKTTQGKIVSDAYIKRIGTPGLPVAIENCIETTFFLVIDTHGNIYEVQASDIRMV